MPEFDVVGVGLNATDTLLMVPHFPAYAGKVPFDAEVMSPGGQVASAMVTCARLGLRAKYIGTVGDDERGAYQMESLRSTGVNLDHVQLRKGCPNQSAYIIVDRSTGERTVLWRREDCLRIDPEEIADDQITGARLLHIDGHDTPAVAHAAAIARRHGFRSRWTSIPFTTALTACCRTWITWWPARNSPVTGPASTTRSRRSRACKTSMA
jgi:sulfofructose kinase